MSSRPETLVAPRSRVGARLSRALAGLPWRAVLAGPLVALATIVWALVATHDARVPFRDPDHVAALYLVLVAAGVVLMAAVDVAIRAGRPLSRAAMARVRRERWTPARIFATSTALVSFYASYMAYRNLKAIVPLLRPDVNYDQPLAELERDLFFGHDPAALLHALPGQWVTTHFLSTFYVAFIVFLPLSLAIALVFASNLRASLFFATALSANWILGALTYFWLPSLGPIYAFPEWFAHLPVSQTTHLQETLMDQRVAFLADPVSSTPQAIAAFASLHVSMSLTAAISAHLFGLGRKLKIALWIWVAITLLDTIYLGWHYVLDDVAGVAITVVALALAWALTGVNPRARSA
jgi:membrane-associated phospholipid phosphatase